MSAVNRDSSDDEKAAVMADAKRRLRALFDEIDETTRKPGEPPLREQVAAQARERLREMGREPFPRPGAVRPADDGQD